MKLKISNDAFFYLTNNEEPIDDNSWDEIAELEATFENGFDIELINALSTGEFEVNIIPKASFKEKYDGCIHLHIKSNTLYFNIIGKNKISGICINDETKKEIFQCSYDVVFIGRDKKPSLKHGTTQLPLWTNDADIWNIDKFNENIISV